MEPKKSKRADIDKKRGIFFQVGLILSLLFVIIAFEWRQREPQTMDLMSNLIIDEDEELADITRQQDEPPPPPPPPEIQIVEDDVIIEEKQKLHDVEADERTEIKLPDIKFEETVDEPDIFLVVENMPEYKGGMNEMMRFLQRNIRYPQMERENGISGTVIVTFVVERDGSITDVRILRGVSPGLDREAIRVVQSMPRWEPGKQRGRPVRVQFNLPIRFTLQ